MTHRAHPWLRSSPLTSRLRLARQMHISAHAVPSWLGIDHAEPLTSLPYTDEPTTPGEPLLPRCCPTTEKATP